MPNKAAVLDYFLIAPSQLNFENTESAEICNRIDAYLAAFYINDLDMAFRAVRGSAGPSHLGRTGRSTQAVAPAETPSGTKIRARNPATICGPLLGAQFSHI